MATEHNAHAPATDPVHPDVGPDALAKKVFIITILACGAFAGFAMIFVL